MAAIDAHPAVKAVSPQAPVSAWMRGDDFSHNGAFLLPHAFNFYIGFGWPRTEPTESNRHPFIHGTPDEHAFFLDIGPVKNLNKRFMRDSVEFWNAMTTHWKWDEFWEARDVLPHLRNIRPAMLFVGGWFDTENLWGALNAYAETERHNPRTSNQLVMGPWSHGQWGGSDGSVLGPISWGMPTASFYRDSIEFPFFRHHLEGKGEPWKFEAAMFLTGKNEWRFLESWPPKACDTVRMFVREGGKLAMDPPAGGSEIFDEYVNDPSKPVPYTDEITHWYNPAFMLGDQRFASWRPDVLTYQSDTLKQDFTVAGPIDARLFVSTSGTDCDWIVKVIDVFPDYAPDPNPNPRQVRLGGYQMLVRGDVMRGKFRESMTNPRPLVPGEITAVNFTLQDIFHDFKKGHRIMVQIQSSWFPMIDRNPGKFLNIFDADETDFQATKQRIYHSAAYPSSLVVHRLR
jgi:putative CocE/NonD family hydrolase